MREFSQFDPHLVLLDISLPFYSGFHWCQQIRRVSKVPIVFISSASDNMNIVMAMTMGADDFIAKPFDLTVLSAKIQALLRRAYDFAGTAHLLSCGGAVLNVARLRKKLESAGLTDYYSLWAHQIKTPIAAMDLLLQEDGPPTGASWRWNC